MIANLHAHSKPWGPELLAELNAVKKGQRAKSAEKRDPRLDAPISALYLFGSTNKKEAGVIRAGAIGIHRAFDQERRTFRSGGNTSLRRFRQYNAHPKGKRAEGDCRPLKADRYPWRAIPWEMFWLREFDREVLKSSELGIIEQLLHFHLEKVGFEFQGSSCYKCRGRNDKAAAIRIADAVIDRFQEVAPGYPSGDGPLAGA